MLAAWSPPIGWGLPTGLRQTTLPLPSGAIACLYTDGLADASTGEGILGRARLPEIVSEAGRDATAQDVLDAVAGEAVSVRDDMAACLIAPDRNVSAGAFRTELLEIGPSELHEGLAVRFLEECHVPEDLIEKARDEARPVVEQHGGALMVVNFGVRGSRVEVLPRNVESLQAALATQVRRALDLHEHLPDVSPESRPMNASGMFSIPSTIVSRYFSSPRPTHGPTSAMKSSGGRSGRHQEARDRQAVRDHRHEVLGPGRRASSLYWETAPQIAIRPNRRMRASAALKWSPPTLSK